MKHKPFNIVSGVVIDYMHCVLLGVTKFFLNRWLDKANKTKPFYLGDQVLHVLTLSNSGSSVIIFSLVH